MEKINNTLALHLPIPFDKTNKHTFIYETLHLHLVLYIFDLALEFI